MPCTVAGTAERRAHCGGAGGGVGIGIPKRGLSCLNTEMPSGRSSGEAETEHDGDTKQ